MKYFFSLRYVEVYIYLKYFGDCCYKFIIYLIYEVELSLFFVYYGSCYCLGVV